VFVHQVLSPVGASVQQILLVWIHRALFLVEALDHQVLLLLIEVWGNRALVY
jgi:hypothetical protein